MNKIKFLSAAFAVLALSAGFASCSSDNDDNTPATPATPKVTVKSLDLAQAGTLEEEYNKTEKVDSLKRLSLSGKLNLKDFVFLESLSNIDTLDLSKANITELKVNFGGEEITYRADSLSDYYSLPKQLKAVYLPSSIKYVDAAIFEDQTNLGLIWISNNAAGYAPGYQNGNSGVNFARYGSLVRNDTLVAVPNLEEPKLYRLLMTYSKTGVYMGDHCFAAMGKGEILAGSVTVFRSIGNEGFANVTFGSDALDLRNVESVGYKGVPGNVPEVYFSEKLKKVSPYAFAKAAKLSIHTGVAVPPIYEGVNSISQAFGNPTVRKFVFVPKGSKEAYEKSEFWTKDINITFVEEAK